MRSGNVLEALRRHYRVSVLVGSLYPSLESDSFLRSHCERSIILPPCDNAMDATRLAAEAYGRESFSTIHVFRLAAMPFAAPYSKGQAARPSLHLDLDDIESTANLRLAHAYRRAGNDSLGVRAAAHSHRISLIENAAFRTFNRVYVSSEPDRCELLGRCNAEIRVLRNVVRVPGMVYPPRADTVFKFLFVGTLGYHPNKDAVRYFCGQVLPIIRQKAPRPFMINIIGSGDSGDLVDLNANDVCVVGPVAGIGPWYEESHAVIVPLRAGGGTRIKILEAFSYERPVVSTTIGAEGLDVEPNRHILIADSAEEFASACLQLMCEPGIVQQLTTNARVLVSQCYTIEAITGAVSPT